MPLDLDAIRLRKRLYSKSAKADIDALLDEVERLRAAILSFGSNPAGFDWGVLGRMDELETALEKIRGMTGDPAILRVACAAINPLPPAASS